MKEELQYDVFIARQQRPWVCRWQSAGAQRPKRSLIEPPPTCDQKRTIIANTIPTIPAGPASCKRGAAADVEAVGEATPSTAMADPVGSVEEADDLPFFEREPVADALLAAAAAAAGSATVALPVTVGTAAEGAATVAFVAAVVAAAAAATTGAAPALATPFAPRATGVSLSSEACNMRSAATISNLPGELGSLAAFWYQLDPRQSGNAQTCQPFCAIKGNVSMNPCTPRVVCSCSRMTRPVVFGRAYMPVSSAVNCEYV